KQEVLVNAPPINVRGRLKGSVAVLHDISEKTRLTTALEQAQQTIRALEATGTSDDIIGNRPELMIAIKQAGIEARTPANVLLRGPSGSGKELFAQAIHHESNQKFYKFIRVNCAFYDESSLEELLFGYEANPNEGNRIADKKGLFEEANKGTIFLDEI